MNSSPNITNRRDFIKLAATAGGVLAAMQATGTSIFAKSSEVKDYIPIIDLPYPVNALDPYISERTVKQHYNDHHRNYYDLITGYIKANPQYDKIPLEKLINKTKGGILLEDALFNYGVLLWNHNFYWKSMKPKGGILPAKKSTLTKQIIASYGSMDKFKNKFTCKATELGFGWVWLMKTSSNDLIIVRTSYHDSLVTSKFFPLITIDIWEHAYYMDYGNNSKKYVENFLDHLVNWDFAEANFKSKEIK